MSRPRAVWMATALVVSICLAGSPVAQRRVAATFQLDGIRVTGAARYSAADVIRISGLKVGSTVTASDLTAAANRMASTGLFADVAFQYTTIGTKLTVTLRIEEPQWTMPVSYDNFVWFSDGEITAALRASIPSFDGTAPQTAGMPELLTRSLQALIAAKGIKGTVEFRPLGEFGKPIERFDFRVRSPSPKICGYLFPGASAIPASNLAAALKAGGGDEYSRAFVRQAAAGTLGDMYRQRGHWAATFDEPSTSPASSCDGTTVTLTVREGAVYAWAGAEWAGHAATRASDLDALLALKAGAVAHLNDLRDGVRRVERWYDTHGYIRRRLSFVARLDDSTRRATIVFTVDEGPQFRMGTLEFAGLPADRAASFSKLWKLEAGEVYDGLYAHDFLIHTIAPSVGASVPTLAITPDPNTQVVHVRFTFGTSP